MVIQFENGTNVFEVEPFVPFELFGILYGSKQKFVLRKKQKYKNGFDN